MNKRSLPSVGFVRLLSLPQVNLGRPDVGVPGEFPHLVHRRPISDRVVDRGLAQ